MLISARNIANMVCAIADGFVLIYCLVVLMFAMVNDIVDYSINAITGMCTS